MNFSTIPIVLVICAHYSVSTSITVCAKIKSREKRKRPQFYVLTSKFSRIFFDERTILFGIMYIKSRRVSNFNEKLSWKNLIIFVVCMSSNMELTIERIYCTYSCFLFGEFWNWHPSKCVYFETC